MDSLDEDEAESPANSGMPASFSGRLNLASYAFSPTPKVKKEISSPEPRGRQNLKSITPSPSPKPSPKRKLDNLTPSPSPRKKASRSNSGYAPPSTYAHLPELQDVLEPNLICLFIGLNPGIATVGLHSNTIYIRCIYFQRAESSTDFENRLPLVMLMHTLQTFSGNYFTAVAVQPACWDLMKMVNTSSIMLFSSQLTRTRRSSPTLQHGKHQHSLPPNVSFTFCPPP